MTPSCPPRVAVALRRGDLLVHVDQEPVDATDEGYERLVARLRCGSRPVVLKFWKRSDVEATEEEEVPLTIQVPESPRPRTLRADELSPSSEVEEFDAFFLFRRISTRTTASTWTTWGTSSTAPPPEMIDLRRARARVLRRRSSSDCV